MPSFESILFCVFCAATVTGVLSASLLSTPPSGVLGHARAIARLCVTIGAACEFARAAQGWRPPPEDLLFMFGCVWLAFGKARHEIVRQRTERRNRGIE